MDRIDGIEDKQWWCALREEENLCNGIYIATMIRMDWTRDDDRFHALLLVLARTSILKYDFKEVCEQRTGRTITIKRNTIKPCDRFCAGCCYQQIRRFVFYTWCVPVSRKLIELLTVIPLASELRLNISLHHHPQPAMTKTRRVWLVHSTLMVSIVLYPVEKRRSHPVPKFQFDVIANSDV